MLGLFLLVSGLFGYNFYLTPVNTSIRLLEDDINDGALIMGLKELIEEHREKIFALAGQYGASHVRLFGSIAHGSADEKSDIDFLVDLEPGRSLFDLGGLLFDLEKLLGRKVDVVTPAGLRPRIRQRVLKEAVEL